MTNAQFPPSKEEQEKIVEKSESRASLIGKFDEKSGLVIPESATNDQELFFEIPVTIIRASKYGLDEQVAMTASTDSTASISHQEMPANYKPPHSLLLPLTMNLDFSNKRHGDVTLLVTASLQLEFTRDEDKMILDLTLSEDDLIHLYRIYDDLISGNVFHDENRIDPINRFISLNKTVTDQRDNHYSCQWLVDVSDKMRPLVLLKIIGQIK